jgi:hypothetical protein
MIFSTLISILNILLKMIVDILPTWNLPDLIIVPLADIRIMCIYFDELLPLHEIFFCLSAFITFKVGLAVFTIFMGRNRTPIIDI